MLLTWDLTFNAKRTTRTYFDFTLTYVARFARIRIKIEDFFEFYFSNNFACFDR